MERGCFLVIFLMIVFQAGAQEAPYNPCECSPCRQGSTCLQVNYEEIVCICQPGFTGYGCEEESQQTQDQNINPWGDVSVKNCKDENRISDAGYYYVSSDFQYLNASSTTAMPASSSLYDVSNMCRVVFDEIVSSSPYNMSFDLDSSSQDQRGLGFPGFLYNAKDGDNFDFLFFNIDDYNTFPNDTTCFVTGYMENGKASITKKVACDTVSSQKAFSDMDIIITATVQGNTAQFSFESPDAFSFETEVSTHFAANGRMGLTTLNEVASQTSARGMTISYVPGIPKIIAASPTMGPVAGFTNITIKGEYFPYKGNAFVTIGARSCQVIHQSTTEIVAITPKFSNTFAKFGPPSEKDETPGEELQIQVIFQDIGKLLIAAQKFTYLPDPVITDFYPKNTIVSGGITLTVEGEGLRAVQTHIMQITMVYKQSQNGQYVIVSQQKFTSVCTVISDTKMLCPTPHIELPGQFVNLTLTVPDSPSRKRRSSQTVVSRIRRDDQVVISEHEVSGERLEFYVSFKSDGVLSFTNYTDGNSLVVYANPSLNKFEENIIKYDPNRDNPKIRVKGQYLTIGARSEDYHVPIGMGKCTDISITDNELTCLPPGKEPQTNTSLQQLHIDGAPGVIVYVGYKPYHIGHLDYTGERIKSTSNAATTLLFAHGLITALTIWMGISIA